MLAGPVCASRGGWGGWGGEELPGRGGGRGRGAGGKNCPGLSPSGATLGIAADVTLQCRPNSYACHMMEVS